MRAEEIEGEYEHLADRFINYSDFWINSASLYRKELSTGWVGEMHLILFEMFYPYLSPTGKEEYFRLIKQ